MFHSARFPLCNDGVPMSKNRNQSAPEANGAKPSVSEETTPAASAADVPKPARYRQDGGRETFESIVVAFVLAFLFRAFEAEAFVIPTGSMAPTLYGRHKEANCSACGWHMVFGASDEIDDERGIHLPGRRIHTAVCPNCRFENDVKDAPVFTGDRILVNKFPYEFGQPQRWDVPVFKYPEKPTTNYIKRLVGLPGETIILRRGDVFRVEADRTQTILRKDPEKQKVLQIPVYDLNHPEKPLHEKGWPHRWAAVERVDESQPSADRSRLELGPVDGWSETKVTWREDTDSHSFRIESDQAEKELKWLRYRHIVPSPDDWSVVRDGQTSDDSGLFFQEPSGPQAQLVSDFCGYNTYTGGNSSTKDDAYWVGDLTVSGEIEIIRTADQPEIVLELCEGVRCYRCRMDVTSGKARLISVLRLAGADADEEVELTSAVTPITGPGTFSFRFANVDDRLCLWIDDELIEFGAGAEYIVDATLNPSPQSSDLTPVGIAVRGVSAVVSHLLIQRDIYYRASQADNQASDRFSWHEEEYPDLLELRRALNNPAEWNRLYARAHEARFTLSDDEYLMLGDNSPRSQDSRVWPNMRQAERRHAVPGSALVGRAFFVYWPHGVPFMNNGRGYPVAWHKQPRADGEPGTVRSDYPSFSIPFRPQFERMNRIR